MLFLIPVGTDSPIYRAPWATPALIFVNIVLYPLQSVVVPESLYLLEFGNGWHPIQWVYHAFAHADLGHLVGNMIFLLSFGLIVESMMKTHHYLVLYFLIAILDGFIVQTLMLGADGGAALGASGVIYGLMLTACLCGPERNVRWMTIIFYRVAFFEVPVLLNGMFYFMYDFTLWMLGDFQMSTPMLHFVGGICGLVVALVAYRLDWFELDGEDAISRFRKIFGKDPIVSKAHQERLDAAKKEDTFERVYKFGELQPQVDKLYQYLEEDRYELAKMKYKQIRTEHGKFFLKPHQMIQLINLGTREGDWIEVHRMMKAYLKRFQDNRQLILLNKARLELTKLKKPSMAHGTLAEIDFRELSPKNQTIFKKIRDHVDSILAGN
ncbi:MAG: rhomboid family intramembrane serine protease [Planctomycetota bacterium]